MSGRLVRCPDCGHLFPPDGHDCPRCGASPPIQWHVIIPVVVIMWLALLWVLIGRPGL